MSDFIFGIGFIGFIVFLIWLIVAAVKKKSTKIQIIGLIVSIVIAIVGVAIDDDKKDDDKDPSATGASATATPTPTITQTADPKKQDMTISIISSKIGKDYKDAPILLVEYEFTNNTDKATSFTFLCIDKAFQAGVECDSVVVSDAVDAQQQLNDIQPGVPYKLTVGYNLHDTTQDVEIEITELLGKDVFLKQTVKLAQ